MPRFAAGVAAAGVFWVFVVAGIGTFTFCIVVGVEVCVECASVAAAKIASNPDDSANDVTAGVLAGSAGDVVDAFAFVDVAGVDVAVGVGDGVVFAVSSCLAFHDTIQDAGGIGMADGCGATMAGPAKRCLMGPKFCERWSADITRDGAAPSPSSAVVSGVPGGPGVRDDASSSCCRACARVSSGRPGGCLRLSDAVACFSGDGGGAIKVVCLRNWMGAFVRGVIIVVGCD